MPVTNREVVHLDLIDLLSEVRSSTPTAVASAVTTSVTSAVTTISAGPRPAAATTAAGARAGRPASRLRTTRFRASPVLIGSRAAALRGTGPRILTAFLLV